MEKLRNKLALVVDDEKRNRFALCSYLETRNMRVCIADNGNDALMLMQGGVKPDVILLDMMMPVMDGYEMLAKLKEDEHMKDIPVIAVTARAMKGDKEKCLEAGAWDYLSKPLNMSLLVDTLKKWMQ